MKGIDPIVGTILMVAVVIAAAVVVYYVVMNVVSTQGAQLEQQASQGQEKIVIEEVQDLSNSVSSVGEPILVYIRNLSQRKVDIVQAYVLDKDNSIVCKKVGFDLSVKPMDINVLPIYREDVVLIGGVGIRSDCTTSSLHGTYTVKVVTANGTVAVKKVTLS